MGNAISRRIRSDKQVWIKGTHPMKSLFSRFVKDESGATAIEYGLIAALVSVAAIVALTALGTELSDIFDTVKTTLESAQSN